MAIKYSDSKSFKLEPMKKNRWVFEFSSIPGNTSQEEELAFVAHTCAAPQLTFEKQTMSRMNEKFNYAGSPTWNDLSCSFYDFIRNSGTSGALSAGDILYNWSCMIYNPLTGQMGYKTQYATSATLAQLDPDGNVIRCWNIFGIFPTSVDWGSGLSSEDSGFSEVTCSFCYDIALKVTDSKTSTESA
jgi:hypothetical protein